MNTKPTYEELEISLALYRDAYNTLFYKQIDTQDDLERIKEQTADHLDALHFQCEEIVKLEAEVAKIAKKITIANREHDVLKYRFDTLQTTHTHLWEECHEAWMTIKDSHFSSFETPGPEVGCELSLSDALTNIFTQVYKDQEKQNNKYDVLFKSVGRAWHAIGRSHYNSVVNTE